MPKTKDNSSKKALEQDLKLKRISGLEKALKQAELITDLEEHEGMKMVIDDLKHRKEHIDEVLRLQTKEENGQHVRLDIREIDNYYNIRYAFSELLGLFERARLSKPVVAEKLETEKKK